MDPPDSASEARPRLSIASASLLAITSASWAAIESREFENAELEARYHALIDKLRCLVCQNQNLADSDADLASDLRREVYRMIREGKSNEDVVDFTPTSLGSSTSGSFAMRQDLSGLGIASPEDVGSLHVVD